METVLVVDDSPCVLELLRRVLLIEGYSVLSASDGQDAVEAAAQWPDRIDLLVTDVAMPGMSCALMVERLCRERPSLKVLYISGHSREIVADLGVRSDSFFLQKPFLPVELAQAVRDVLDGSYNDGSHTGLSECVRSAHRGTPGAGLYMQAF